MPLQAWVCGLPVEILCAGECDESLDSSRQGRTSCVSLGDHIGLAMPYVFPHDDWFVYTISLVILSLLYIRGRLKGRSRCEKPRSPSEMASD
jgi:hypothetical protein